MGEIEEYSFIVDGKDYNLKNVPNKALAILKEQAYDSLSAVKLCKEKNSKIKKISDVFMYVGFGAYFLSFWLPSKGRLISQIITCLCMPISLFAEKSFRKKNAQIQPQVKGFNKIHAKLEGELKERNFTQEAFPDCFNEELLKPVEYCELEILTEV